MNDDKQKKLYRDPLISKKRTKPEGHKLPASPKETAPTLKSSLSVAEEQEIKEQIAFQHGVLCQVGMPRSRPEGRTFERTFKNASILLEAGKLWNGNKWVEQPLPFGPKPRLALLHINSEAVRTKSPLIDIGGSYREFCRLLGLSTGGRAFYSLKQQMKALAACRMALGFSYDGKASTLDVKPIERFDAWLVPDGDQMTLWPAELRLAPQYLESLLEHAVPLPVEAIGALSNSALALDLLAFFSRRLYQLNRPVKVPYPLLKEQFGQEYTQQKNFKRKFLQAVKQVKAVYPAAEIEQVTGGLLLKPSRPLVSKTVIQGSLPKPKKPDTFTPENLKEKTSQEFRELFPRLDIYACKADFDDWLKRKAKSLPKDYQKAFIGFAKKWGIGKG